MGCVPFTWPITRGETLLGVFDRRSREVLVFDRGGDHGALRAQVAAGALDAPEIREALGAEAHDRLLGDVELLDGAGAEYSHEAFLAGEISPAFFGSALTNFGIEPFLRVFLGMAPPPGARHSTNGTVEPLDPSFSGFVFKIQANMDPRHRDRIAFVRICSGLYQPGSVVRNVRAGRDVRLTSPQQFFARERAVVEEAWAGDVVGVLDRGALRIGDSLSADGTREFDDIPRFSPEHFAMIRVPDPLRRKHLDSGLRHLSEEGAAQVFYQDGSTGPQPIVGAVGLLQFDVLLHRLRNEYGVEATLERLPYRVARWVTGDAGEIRRAAAVQDRGLVFDAKEQPLLLFTSEWALRVAADRAKGLVFHEVAP
jgi:peptide chain release factor 3